MLLPTGAGWRQVALLKSSGGGEDEHSPEAICNPPWDTHPLHFGVAFKHLRGIQHELQPRDA